MECWWREVPRLTPVTMARSGRDTAAPMNSTMFSWLQQGRRGDQQELMPYQLSMEFCLSMRLWNEGYELI